MYLGALGRIPEFKGGVWTQALVNARWQEIGQPLPAPILPASMVNHAPFPTRGPRMLKGPNDKKPRHVTAEENKFLNFWGKVAVDPYRKQSGISKVAGGILQVASVALPVFGYMNAAASAGNFVAQKDAAKDFEKDAEAIMTPAYELQAAQDAAKAESDLAATLAAMQALRPTSNASPVGVVSPTATDSKPGWTMTEIAVAAIAAGVLLLGVIRK